MMSDSTTKRRLINQLPVTNQTPDLTAFFGATVDEVFQPGNSDALNGYIGHQIAGTVNDFYIAEPTAARSFYQLEPAMISYDATATSTVNYALSYPDMVSYFAVSGANVSNQQRLFETEYYSWSPPINFDMLVNYHQYYWFGDVVVENVYCFNPTDKTSALTVSNGDLTAQWPQGVLVTGFDTDPYESYYFDENNTAREVQAVRSTVLPTGAWYVELTVIAGSAMQYCGLANMIDSIQASPGLRNSGHNAVVYTSTGAIYNDSGATIDSRMPSYGVDDVIGIAWSTTSSSVWFRVNNGLWNNNAAAHPTTGVGGFDLTAVLADGPLHLVWAATGDASQANINFGTNMFAHIEPKGFLGPATLLPSADLPTLPLIVPILSYIGDGSTTVFTLPPSINAVPSSDENPFAFVNDIPVPVAGVGGTTITLQAAPPLGATVIVCRTPDLAAVISGRSTVDVSDINDYGVTWLTSTMRIYIKDCAHITKAWDDQTWDYAPWDAVAGSTYFVDGVGKAIRLTEDTTMLRGLTAQYLTIDRSSNDRASNGWALRNSWVHKDSYAWSGASFPARQATRPIIEFERDLIRYPNQVWSESIAPLFMLYDLGGTPLNDPGAYPGSSFTGNRLFGYASGTTYDSVLRLHLSYDANGYPVFSNDAANQHYTYVAGTATPIVTPINGLLQYALNETTPRCIAFWQPVATTTTQPVGASGFYHIPTNLQANPNYAEVDLISQSTWNPHFSEIITNQIGFSGTVGDNDYRDTLRDTTLGIGIVQHVAPLLKTMLLASSTDFDVIDAIRYVELEYTRFKNKFVRKLNDLSHRGAVVNVDLVTSASTAADEYILYFTSTSGVSLNSQVFLPGSIYTGTYVQAVTPTTVTLSQPVAASIAGGATIEFIGPWLSAALAALKIGHNNSFPFALSPMAGGQYFIPATPTALGLLPAAVPSQIIDTSFGTAMTMLLGHDGSLTPTFGDWRDAVMLELETLIYTNLPSQFQTEARPTFDLHGWVGSRFHTRVNGYTFAEYTAITAPMFELWAQINHVDYRRNTGYDATDPFTWNYNGVADRFGNPLPGNWRGIYLFYFDTFAPHLRPWEMLGFVCEPSWWQSHYGIAPYTSGNTQLWSDLANGVIASGPRAGIDARYARPGLSNLIPVDASGNLLDPVACGIVTVNVTYETGTRNWAAGDIGPLEAAWRYHSSARFADAQAGFLMKPARFVEQGWDALGIGYVSGQWVMLDGLQRPYNAAQYVHGETTPSGTTQVITGLSQWLVDYMVSSGASATVLGEAVRGLSVNLMHQMAGFVPADTVSVATDSFGLLPGDDVQTILYQSPAVSSEVYSGVIIEWTGTAWKVIGYDGRNPYFTIIPPNTAGARGLISIAGASEPAIVPWRPGTYYPIQILISYQNSVYQCIRSHTSTTTFEQVYWSPRADLSTNMIQAPRVITYATGLNRTVAVPYGTEYTTYQDIADFLLGWERWLLSRGWLFTGINPTTNDVLNWSLSVEEFLSWAQVQWAPGNFIALSPGQAELKFIAPTGTIMNVENNITGFFGLIDRAGQPIGQHNAIVSRLDGAITLAAKNADVYLARLDLYNIEHALVANNVTVFANEVYLPLFNLRQERLLLACSRAANWAGRLDAPGFVITGNTLASSFEKAATDVGLMFDIERADVPTLRNYARHNIGMQQRDYFNNLLLSANTQFEFYQGMIQEKGTPGALSALTRSTLVATADSSLQFLEEWAFRIGVFGAPPHPFITFQLTSDDVRDNPQFVCFAAHAAAPLDWIELTANDSRWRDEPETLHVLWQPATRYVANDIVANGSKVYRCIGAGISVGLGGSGPTGTGTMSDGTVTWLYLAPVGQFFPERIDFAPALLPTGGPVRTDEVSEFAFSVADIPNIYDSVSHNLPSGARIWVYDGTPTASGTHWYVDAITGNDLAAGTAAAPFQTLQQAHDVCNPGDVVNVVGGLNSAGNPTVYTADAGTNVLEITRSGTPALPIVFQAMPGMAPPVILGTQSAAAVHFNAASYVTLRGFTIIGWNASVSLADAQTDAFAGLDSPAFNGCGIVIDAGISNVVSHHDHILDCTISAFPGSGILVNGADYVTVDGNTVYGCGQYSPLMCGGIDVINSTDIDNNTDYKTYITGNTCYGNFNQVPNVNNTFASGGGILIDGNQIGSLYGGRTLVANNLCYDNGGNGILVRKSGYVDVIYNSTYQNQTNLSQPTGEIFDTACVDCKFYNNILVALGFAPVTVSIPILLGYDDQAYDVDNYDVNFAVETTSVYVNNIAYGGNGATVPGVAGLDNPLYAGLPPWLSGTQYNVGSRVYSNGDAYACLSGGISGSNPPSGQQPICNDGGLRWKWVAVMTNPRNPFQPLRGSPAIGCASTVFTVPSDRAGVMRTPITGYDIGCYQATEPTTPVIGTHPYDVQECFDIGTIAAHGTRSNMIQKVMVPGTSGAADSTVDAALATTRIFFTLPISLTTDDVGNYLVVDGLADTYPELEGVQTITGVHIALNAVDIEMVCSAGADFTDRPTDAPTARVLRSVRFASLDAINPNYSFTTGDLVWIDNYNSGYIAPQQWAVMQYDGSAWSVYRLQPHRTETKLVIETTIYKEGAQIIGNQMILNQPVVPALDVIDPLEGLIAGVCAREITYQIGYDPANYNAGYGQRNADAWGVAQIGHVWWDLSTVRFLDPYTDVLGVSNDRDIAELQYRSNNWARLAPGASVDVYEWIESATDPLSYSNDSTMPGTVYHAEAPAWVEQTIYNASTGQDVTRYYFWVAGLTAVPDVSFRTMSTGQVATGIRDPMSLGNVWMSPICAFGLLVGNAAATVNDTTTVMKVAIDAAPDRCGRNDQWQLMRSGDETSLPPDRLWNKLRDSLAGFSVQDATVLSVPDPALSIARNTGIYDGQSMFRMSAQPVVAWLPHHVYYYGDLVALGGFAFMCVTAGTSGDTGPSGYASIIPDGTTAWTYHGVDGTRGGLLAARAAFISSVNGVFAKIALWKQRTVALENIVGGSTVPARATPYASVLSDPTKPSVGYLMWMQPDASHAYDPPPSVEWDAPYEVHSLSQRNDLLASDAFQLSALPIWTLSTAYTVGYRVINGGNAYVCITAGTSSGTSSSGPLGNGAIIQDGSAQWQWLAALVNGGGPISVLLSGYANSTPQWSIWTYSPHMARSVIGPVNPLLSQAAQIIAAIGILVKAADQVFALKTAYEYSVTRIDQRDALTIMNLQRVLVTDDVQNFWTIYQWRQSGSANYQLSTVGSWTPNTRYGIGTKVQIDGNIYQCITAGVSGGSAIGGTASVIPDGTKVGNTFTGVTWKWVCGYQLWRAQTYDFDIHSQTPILGYADWYDTATLAANDLSPNDPPIVSYAPITSGGTTLSAETIRNITEGSNPTNRFVKLTSSASGVNLGWVWTAYLEVDPINKVWDWQVVAIGNGTVALSTRFADPSRPLYAVSTSTSPQTVNLADIQKRDGSWEMRVLVQALRHNGLLLDHEINQIWFDMINFVHVQQNEVDWAFKTSFLNLLGLNVPLAQTPVMTVDQTNNITAYVNEVIPYRVKIRESTIQYTAPIDDAMTHVTDFDDPLYFDPVSKLYRALDPTDVADQAILQTAPWSDWYDKYLTAPALIRTFKITLLFDRLSPGVGNWDMSGWDSQPWGSGEEDTAAAYRILSYYAPTPGMPPIDTSILMNLAEKENQESGGTLHGASYAGEINTDDGFSTTPDSAVNPPLTSRPGGYDLRAPYYAANHPEERIPFSADDGVQIIVSTAPAPGAPQQKIKVYNVGDIATVFASGGGALGLSASGI